MRKIDIPAPFGTLAVRDSGEAHAERAAAEFPPLVLLHGMVTDSRIWDATLASLRAASGRRVVLPELRGHGASSPPADGDYSIRSCAGDLQRVLDALDLDRIDLVGHSYGSLVALEAASREPRRIARLVLADPPGDFTWLPAEVRKRELDPFAAALESDAWRQAAAAGFEQSLGEDAAPATRELILRSLAAAPRELVVGIMRSMFAYDPIRALDAYVATPGAVAHTIVAPANAWPYSLHVVRPALAATVVPRTGHWLQLDAPQPFAAALDAALGATETAPD